MRPRESPGAAPRGRHRTRASSPRWRRSWGGTPAPRERRATSADWRTSYDVHLRVHRMVGEAVEGERREIELRLPSEREVGEVLPNHGALLEPVPAPSHGPRGGPMLVANRWSHPAGKRQVYRIDRLG